MSACEFILLVSLLFMGGIALVLGSILGKTEDKLDKAYEEVADLKAKNSKLKTLLEVSRF